MDYIVYLLDLPNMSPLNLLSLFLLGFFRLAPIMAITPFFGAQIIPVIGRTGLAIFLSIVFMPVIIATTPSYPDFNHMFLWYSLKELAIGSVLGFLAAIPFYTVQSAGIIIDFQRGSSIMMAQDPTLRMQVSSIGIFFNYIMITIFFQIGGPFFFFDAVASSFELVSVTGNIHSSFFHINIPFWETAINIMNKLFSIAIQLAAPALVAILMAETFLGIANRLAPQVQIAFLGMPLKSLLAFLILWLGWYVIIKQFDVQAHEWFEMLRKLINTSNYYNIAPTTS